MKNSFLLLLFCSCSTVLCQTGAIEGRIWDRKSDSWLAYCNVNIYSASKGATADKGGRFRITELPVGKYDVRVSMIGYGDTTLTGVHVGADSTTVVQVALPCPARASMSPTGRTRGVLRAARRTRLFQWFTVCWTSIGTIARGNLEDVLSQTAIRRGIVRQTV